MLNRWRLQCIFKCDYLRGQSSVLWSVKKKVSQTRTLKLLKTIEYVIEEIASCESPELEKKFNCTTSLSIWIPKILVISTQLIGGLHG